MTLIALFLLKEYRAMLGSYGVPPLIIYLLVAGGAATTTPPAQRAISESLTYFLKPRVLAARWTGATQKNLSLVSNAKLKSQTVSLK